MQIISNDYISHESFAPGDYEVTGMYPFKEYEEDKEQYMGELALRHREHMEYYERGLITSQNFVKEIVHEVYVNNLYALSWFYKGVYPFDSYETDRDSYLYELSCEQKLEEEFEPFEDF
jgi:hypothetical protein